MKSRKNEKKKKRTDNELGDEGTKSICESLKINASLTTLVLDGDERVK